MNWTRTGVSSSGEQANELAHGLARDDGLHRGVFVINVDFAAGETMSVGGDGAQLLALDDEEHAVEVVADVLTGHGEGRHREQVAQRAGRDEERRLPLAFLEDGVFVGGERLKLELAVVAADREVAVAEVELDLVGGGKSRQDAGELGGADREAGVDAGDADGSLGADLMSRSVAENLTFSPFCSIRMLLRIGSVWRFSTMPSTILTGLSRFSQTLWMFFITNTW